VTGIVDTFLATVLMNKSFNAGVLGRDLVQEVCMVMIRRHKPTFCIDLMRKLTNKLSSDVRTNKKKIPDLSR